MFKSWGTDSIWPFINLQHLKLYMIQTSVYSKWMNKTKLIQYRHTPFYTHCFHSFWDLFFQGMFLLNVNVIKCINIIFLRNTFKTGWWNFLLQLKSCNDDKCILIFNLCMWGRMNFLKMYFCFLKVYSRFSSVISKKVYLCFTDLSYIHKDLM